MDFNADRLRATVAAYTSEEGDEARANSIAQVLRDPLLERMATSR